MKKIAIIGSTGSIGTSTCQVARHLKNQLQVVALAAHSNIDLLEKQAIEFQPQLIAVYDEAKAHELSKRLPHFEVVSGMDGVVAVATHPDVEFVVSAMTGTQGLKPTLAAIHAGKNVGLANKEALVSGGKLVMDAVKKNNVQLLPIDSEHSAIFQCLRGENPKAVRRLILTASGGPFREYTFDQLKSVTLEQALRHPTWTMGAKVTIDSSTLMNKGLEVIEAHWLFNIPHEKIDVVVHPQSIIHSMVEYEDLSIIAQMGEPSMITPIQYALTYPDRLPGIPKPFDFTRNNTLTFFPPDLDRFRCLKLAYQALKEGDTCPGYMNAANEVLVGRYLRKEIGWMEISHKLQSLMDKHHKKKIESIDDVFAADRLAREQAAHI